MELVSQELRRIADGLGKASLLFADEQTEKRLQEIKQKFMESWKKSHGLEHLDPERVWKQMKETIKREIKLRPFDW